MILAAFLILGLFAPLAFAKAPATGCTVVAGPKVASCHWTATASGEIRLTGVGFGWELCTSSGCESHFEGVQSSIDSSSFALKGSVVYVYALLAVANAQQGLCTPLSCVL